jgi:hypothetical protein
MTNIPLCLSPHPGPVTRGNRLVMAPLYLGSAGEGGLVRRSLREHYCLTARSRVGLVVLTDAPIKTRLGGAQRGRPERITTSTWRARPNLPPPSKPRELSPHSRSTLGEGLPQWPRWWRLSRWGPLAGFLASGH